MEKLPTDVRRALIDGSKVEALWMDLTPLARMDFLRWVESAKQPETRKRRIERTRSMLKEGKRRPCCYAVVPMNFYRALAGTPKAKAGWSKLSPIGKIEFVSWVESAKESETRRQRVEQACLMLVAGKQHPE